MLKKQSKTGQKDNQPLYNHNSEIVHVEEKKYPSFSILSAAAVAVIFITLGATIHYTTVSLTNFNLEYSELQLPEAETAERNKENKNLTQIEKNKTETTRLQTNERSKTRARERREIVLKKHQNYISLDKIVKKLKNLTKIRNRRHLPKHLLHRYLSLIQQIEEQNRHHINLTLAAKNFVESVVKHIDSYKKNSTKRNIEEDIEETTDEVYPKVLNDETEKILDHTSTPSYSYNMNNEIKADITALTKVENKVEVETGITNFTMVTEPNNDDNSSEKQSRNETSNQNKNNSKPDFEQHKNVSFENIKTNNTHYVYVNQIKSNQTNKQHYSKDRVNTNTSFIYHFHNSFLDNTQSNKKTIYSLTNIQTSFYEISVARSTSLNNATKSFQSEVKSREFLINNQLLPNTKNKSQITDVYETKYSLQTSKIILQASEIYLKNSEFSQHSSESLPASKISLQDSEMNLQANEMYLKTSEIYPQASKTSMHVSKIHFQVSETNLQASEITSQISLINFQASKISTLQVSESVQVNQNHNFPAKSLLPEINLSNKSKYEAHSIITNMNALKNVHFKNQAKKVDLKPSYSSHFSRHSFENSFKQEAMQEINVHSNNPLVMKSSILGEILPTKSFTTKTQLDPNPTMEDSIYGTNTMTTSINITSSFTKHLDDDDQDLKDFFAHVQIENSSIIRTNLSWPLSVNTNPTTMFTLPSHRIIQPSSHAVTLINLSTTNRSKLFVSTTVSSFHQAKNTGASTVFIQQNNINTKFSKSNKNILIGDLFDSSEKISENLQQNKKEIKISDSVNNKNSDFSINFVTSSIAVTSSDTSINFVISSNSVTTQPAYYNEYNSQSNPTTNAQAPTIVKTNSDDLHHTIKNEQRTQNLITFSKKLQHSFSRNNTNNDAAYSTKSYNIPKNHMVMNDTIIFNNQVGEKNTFATLQPTLQTMQQQQLTTWQHITNPITDLLISNEAKSRDQITQILSDSETQDKKTNVGPGVIKFLQQTLLHIDENAKLAVKATNSSVNTSPYTLDWICRNDVTDWSTAYIIGMSRFLQNHIINCKQNEFLQKFRLSDNKDNFFPLFRYEYVCCSLALVKT
ncbi:probable serine/threonine-protein kinase DDB_G0282963 isoform X1 [Hydra vulgaris]|uniref:probable serine/threonine-protein kinase DDB_G0282963 isoform X1 n=1 Tax=Hydra vulgaris TaxID=6087 RepID=UPI001F5E38AF|nr:probable serine/threonine-protein kinase DDB_G0282963 [Hydra vulgaris]